MLMISVLLPVLLFVYDSLRSRATLQAQVLALRHQILVLHGGAGGNLAGALFKKFSLGPVGNTIVGLIGGGPGQQLLNAAGFLQSTGLMGDIGGSVAGGGILMTVVGLIKNAMAENTV